MIVSVFTGCIQKLLTVGRVTRSLLQTRRQFYRRSWTSVQDFSRPSVIFLTGIRRLGIMAGKKKLIIDCDAGTDDAQAILMALAYNDLVEVVAITTVFGNSNVENTTRNVLRVLKLCSRLDIPVYKGCACSFTGSPPVGDDFHGNDGLGDIPDLDPPNCNLVNVNHAANVLIDQAREKPGEISLIAIGPLTNLAVAIRMDPNFGSNLKDCFIMGGNTEGRGNITVTSEFNFYSDPEGAYVTLTQLGCPIYLFPMELCELYSFSWEWYDKFKQHPTKKGAFIRDVEVKMIDVCMKSNIPIYTCWDQLAMAAAIDDNIVLETKKVYVTVEYGGHMCRGQMVVDWRNKLKKEPNVIMVTKCDKDLYEKMLYKAID